MLLSNLDVLATAPGGVARLRELILTLAVQGKLVPQDSSDEPASVLLKNIRVEKDRLIARRKIKRDKSLTGIAQEEKPFELPHGWEWVRCSDYFLELCTGPFGSVIHREDYVHDGVPLINPSHMLSGRIVHDPRVTLNQKDAERLSAYALSAGDIVLARRGEVGRYALVTARENGWLCGTGSFFVRLHKSCNREYLGLLFTDSRFRQHLQGESVGTTMTNLNQGILLGALIALPPLAEQSRIVTRVEELMRLCDALEAKGRLEAAQHAQLVSTLLGTLLDSPTPTILAENWQRIATHFDLLLDRPQAVDALEQTILQLAVRGLLVPQNSTDEPAGRLLQKIRQEKDRLIAEGKIKRDKPLVPIVGAEEPFALPHGWELISVATVFDTTSGSTFDLGMEKESGAYMYVKVGDMNLPGNEFEITTSSRFIDPDEKTAKALIPSGSIIFPKRGGAIATNKKRIVGTPIFVDLNTMAITPIVVLTEYAFLWLTTIDLATLNTGTSVPQINHKDIDPLSFPLPPLAEQSRIVTRVASLRRLCADLRRRLSASQSTQAHLAEALVESVTS